MTTLKRLRSLAWLVSLAAPLVTAAADPTAAMFDPARVIDIDIRMPADDWDRLRAQERTLVSLLRGDCLAQPFHNPYTWFPARVTIDGQVRENAGVRKKGFLGSLDTVKPALKIDLEEFQDNAAIHGIRKLMLNNAKQDPALVRQCIGYQLFAQAGVPAPRCNFAHVTVNGAPLGIYANVEEIRKPLLARHFADNSGNLYEGTISDFHPVLVRTFEMQSNESTNDRSDLAGVIGALAASDAELPAALGSKVDLDAFRTYWAMEGLVGFWDGHSGNRNNFYLYNDPSSGRFHFMPWGIDEILVDGSPIAALNAAAPTSVFAYSAITRRLIDQPGEWSAYVARMNALLASVWNEPAIHAEIDRMQALLSPYTGDLSAELSSVRTFVDTRRARVSSEIAGPKPTFPPLSILDYCTADIGAVSGVFAATWGTHGQPPLSTGSASLLGTVVGLDVGASAGGADAGLSSADPNRHRGFLTMHFARPGGLAAQLDAIVDSTKLVPGAALAIDGQQVKASLALTEGLVLLDRGTLKLTHASTQPGGRVCGTFEANAYTFTGRFLVSGPPDPPPLPPFAGLTPPRPDLGALMRDCKPGRAR